MWGGGGGGMLALVWDGRLPEMGAGVADGVWCGAVGSWRGVDANADVGRGGGVGVGRVAEMWAGVADGWDEFCPAGR